MPNDKASLQHANLTLTFMETGPLYNEQGEPSATLIIPISSATMSHIGVQF